MTVEIELALIRLGAVGLLMIPATLALCYGAITLYRMVRK